MNNYATIKSIGITKQDLEKINQYTRRVLSVDEVFIFSIILCDNEIDRDFERFSQNTLHELSKLYVGKTGIFDHNPKGKNQSARIFDTAVVIDETKKNSLGMPYAYLKAKAYMVKSNKNADMILDIDAGITKEVSVSCSVEIITCSICNANQRKEGCEHQKGKQYDGLTCHYLLENAVDAYEWSFVAVPAQVNAGVVKAFSQEKEEINIKAIDTIVKSFETLSEESIVLSKQECKALSVYINEIANKAKLGAVYQAELISEVKRLAFLVNDNLPNEVIDSVSQKMSIAELKAFQKAYALQLEKKNGEQVKLQLKAASPSGKTTINEFKV